MSQVSGHSAFAAEICVRCGGPAEHDFVDFWLCTECYYVAGSTCAGINLPKSARRSDPVC